MTGTTFHVSGISSAGIAASNLDGSTGTFKVAVSAAAPTGVQGARVGVWCSADMSDLHWYTATKEGSQYVITVDVANHKYHFGNYKADAYAVLGSGAEQFACGTTVNLVANNYCWVEKNARGQYWVSVRNPNPSAGPIQIPTWSQANGQDDLVWYSANNNGDGSWSVLVESRNHKDGGLFYSDIYSGGTYLGGVTFTIPADEMLTEAEWRIENLRRSVYNKVGTDLYANYKWVVDNFSYVRRSGHLTPPPGYTREQWYAIEGFEKQSGNCYTYAATFCQLAKGLGYNAEYVEGDVYGVGNTWWPHGIVLIHMNGTTYICDPELESAGAHRRNLYMQPISNPRATYRW